MTETVKVSLTYDSDAEGKALVNDSMLFALDLEFAAREYDVQFACKSNTDARKLDIVLSGARDRIGKFLEALKSKKVEYNGVKDYRVGERREFHDKTPDWGYHDSLVAMRAAYLRTEYMSDVRNLLEKLANHPKLGKIAT